MLLHEKQQLPHKVTKQIETQEKQIGSNKTAFVTNHVKQIRRLHAMQRVSTLSVKKTSNPEKH